jgi:hypothetical protein
VTGHGDEERREDDQLSAEDTLEDRGLDDPLDEGYSPPEKLRGSTAKSVTPRGELEGETIDERLAQEEPDPEASLVYGADPEETPLDRTDPPIDESVTAPAEDDQVGERRSGRIEHEDDRPDGTGRDRGIAGGAASAEEAAVHDIA